MDERSFTTQQASSSRDVLKFYDAYAPSWDERFGVDESVQRFHRMRLASLTKLARFQKMDEAVELGVGTGPYVADIAPLVRSLRCIDGAAGMLEVLARKHRALPNVSMQQVDLEHGIGEGFPKADVVYWFGLIEHIIDAEPFVMNCRAMLKPGGRLVFAAPNGRCPWYGSLRRIWRSGAHCTSDHYYTPEECDALFGRRGFTRTGLVYWGYAPAGVSGVLYALLTAVGAMVDLTPLRRYAGGMTLSYVLEH
jgi:2-polyprenyl-3-methyl-5-hydroxy-6-metoxy-1,4-benzoquinol methylase